MSSREPLLSVNCLTIDYISEHSVLRAVDNVSFNIYRGEAFGLAGESGCGKTTIAFALARLTRLPGLVTGGNVEFEGEDVFGFNGEKLRKFRWNDVSFVFQSAMNALNPVIPISEQITDVMKAHSDVSDKDARDRAIEMFELVGIDTARLDDYAHQFSGGMRQRICIAIALVLKPKLIIMDEPTTALDVVVQRDIIKKIHDLKKEMGFSILFITHDLSLMSQFCDRIGVMLNGKLVEVETVNKILNEPQHDYTKLLWDSIPTPFGDSVIQQFNTDKLPVGMMND